MSDTAKQPANLQPPGMSAEEFAEFRSTTARQLKTLVDGMEFPRVLFAISAVIALLSSELDPEIVEALMQRARQAALAATAEQLAAGK